GGHDEVGGGPPPLVLVELAHGGVEHLAGGVQRSVTVPAGAQRRSAEGVQMIGGLACPVGRRGRIDIAGASGLGRVGGGAQSGGDRPAEVEQFLGTAQECEDVV